MTDAIFVIESVNEVLKLLALSAIYAVFIAGLLKVTLMIVKAKVEDDD